MQQLQLLFLGLFIHVIFLLSVFDIYFKSPIVQGITPVVNNFHSGAERVVLISIDGLPIDSLMETDPASGEYIAPYIRHIMKERGSWGVAQSHIPTESRPGHVAMLAGFNEDPSAVMKGWKQNPVDFDSIFNQSYCSFAWGSPDIVNVFFKDLKHNCSFPMVYDNEQEFSGDSRKLDNWVFSHAQSFLNKSKSKALVQHNKIFFFLHLLGQDTSGHSDKPHTEMYRRNLRNVDNIVRDVENLFTEFFEDQKTAFVVTADHGMTDWGSHGSGDPSETDVPFVAWGAGINGPRPPFKEMNISQTDITPFLAVLLGVSIPVNSVGVVPFLYLNTSRKGIAEAMFLNAMQMTSQFDSKFRSVEEQTLSWLFSPFEKLTIEEMRLSLRATSDLIIQERFEESIQISKALIDLCLEGLDYYHSYHRRSLFVFITLSYLGWILYLLLSILPGGGGSRTDPCLTVVTAVVVAVTAGLIAIQGLPYLFYCYYLLPEFLWFQVLREKRKLQWLSVRMRRKENLTALAVILAGVEVLVAGFFFRWILSISMCTILVWSLLSISRSYFNKFLVAFWLISGISLSVFVLLPVVGSRPCGVMILISFLFLTPTFYDLSKKRVMSTISAARGAALAVAAVNNFTVQFAFENLNEVPWCLHNVSWLLLFISCLLLFAPSQILLDRLLHVFSCLSVAFILLSISHEVFFLFFLYINLCCWVLLETVHQTGYFFPMAKPTKVQSLSLSDFRIAYFFLSYISIGFFGIGNIASLNSFDPAWLRCFVTVFSPFLMSSLILLKTIIPFLAVTCTLSVLSVSININLKNVFVIVLMYCNIMGLNFLYMITNTGSWLEIGTSLSHYVIQQVTVVFLVVLYGVAQVLMHKLPISPLNFNKSV